MKKASTLFLASLLALTIGLASVPVRAADEASDISNTQADQIRQNCKQAQSTLQRLQTTDIATRVNRGRIYESLINQLITPFDSRVSFNRYNASNLNSAATTITQKFTTFKNDYQSYANSLSNLLSVNCEANPRGFYSILTTTRGGRERVGNDITDLNTALDKYTDAFSSLRNDIGDQ